MTQLVKALSIVLTLSATVLAQMPTESKMMEIEQSILTFFTGNDPSALDSVLEHFVEIKNQTELAQELQAIKEQLSIYTESIGVDGTPNGLQFYFSSVAGEKVLAVDIAGEGISAIRLEAVAPRMVLTKQNISALVDSLESAGYAGLLYAQSNGDVWIEQPFGFAIPSLNLKNTSETIFAIGSRPIDFTVAGIQLLDQQGKLSVNDFITEFFTDVPSDKVSMTVQHLLTGASGLPDFFETEDDWDADLAWIDRETAEQRLLNIELLFKPGTANQHSHAAFGLLAAIIERVSGQPYYTFIKTNFFEPAGMKRTGEYGESLTFSLSDFAEGMGPQRVGLPNIPPNWGPTSWLIKGSGGMFSTLDDLQRFYQFIHSGNVLDEEHQQIFKGEMIQLDGSMRGFELFSISSYEQNRSLYLFLNQIPDRDGIRQVFRGLEQMMLGN